MAYSFPVFRKGMIFKTVRLVSSEEAKKIAARIKSEYQLYNQAFKSSIAHNNQSVAWGDEKGDPQELQQYIKESYILNFPLITFRYNGFSVEARNSVTVCRHQHRSKIWTRLSCARFGENKTELNVSEVRKFFNFAAANADGILSALTATYMKHIKEAGIVVPRSGAYLFQLRAFNSTTDTSRTLLNQLQNGLAMSDALDDKRFRPELVEYFEIALGKKTSSEEIKKSIRTRDVDIFGYKSSEHEALFTARVTKNQTDVCGYGYDDTDVLKSNVLSHAATMDLLKEYAQNF
jgi:hypothetical protein